MKPELTSNDLDPDEQREVVKRQVELLFSGQPMTLAAMIEMANQLENTAGVASFHTAVPWQLKLPDNQTIAGSSLNLAGATRDLQGQLKVLQESFPLDATVALSIDDTRLQSNVSRLSGKGGSIARP
jgi:hypothetical protein